MKSKTPVISVLLLTAAAGTHSAIAAELEEIIVTAQKREQSVQDVGIAINAFTGDELASLNITNTSDIASQSPGVEQRRHFVSRGMLTNFFMRGVGSTDFNDGTESAVTVYVDDFYLMSASTVDFGLMDIERAEVIKGPQGTLFGRNATGGAIQFVTNKPQFDEFSGFVEAGFGTDEIMQLQGNLNIPVNDTFAIRLAGSIDDHDHYVENINSVGSDAVDQNFYAFRASARFKPSEAFDATYKVEVGKVDGNLGADQAIVSLGGQPDGDVILDPDNTNAYGYNPDVTGESDPDKIDSEGFNSGFNDVMHHLLRIESDVSESIMFTSITGYLDQDYAIYEDCDGTPSIICNYEAFFQSQHFTQELRLNGTSGRTHWTVGLFYLDQDASGGLQAPLYFTIDGNEDPSGQTAGLGFYADYDIDVRSMAAFGQLEFAVTDTVTLIGGLRWSNDQKTFEQTYPVYNILTDNDILPFTRERDFELSSHTVTSLLLSNDFTKETAGNLTETDDDLISGTLQANWQPSDTSLYYLSYRRGVKAAGFNNGSVPAFDITVEQYPFDEETLDAYELGAKLTFANNTIRFNAAAFYYDYQDYQATTFPESATGGILQTNRDATIQGAEFEFFATPIDNLDISLGLALLDTTVKDVSRGAGLPFVDREMGEAPDTSVNGLVRYSWSWLGGTMSAQASAVYTSERYTDALNLSVGVLESNTIVDAQLGYESDDQKWSVLLWGRNLTDERVLVGALATLTGQGIGQAQWNEKPTAGVKVGYRF